MFEDSDRIFKTQQQSQQQPEQCQQTPQQPTMLLLSPPPYTTPSSPSSQPQTPHPHNDDYRCTITPSPPDTTTVHISILLHTHLDTDRIPCWRVRRRLIALDQPICSHRCTSDPAFFRAVRRRMNTLCISFGSREYLPFFGRWTSKSRTWRCGVKGCNMEAWICEDRDTGVLRLNAKTQWSGELREGDREALEGVRRRAVLGGGLVEG
ncbi:hypothetical protein E8E13_008233 [Curvularia kusanoi]|uniref:Uncharacterized protein n=1 Tax=Curvularia kusanoi TaxID=90978 RepID=A0A9P4TMJ2_CURKU|nr:hypothetical protein E8E13_008233 [Curvularia kusanoi]